MCRKGENIYKRKDNRWQAKVLWKYGPNGKAIYKYLYGKSYREVKEKKEAFLKEINGQKEKDTCICAATTFAEAAVDWLSYKQGGVKASTLAVYQGNLERYLLPQFGSVPVQSIDSKQVDDFLLYLLQHGKKKLQANSSANAESVKESTRAGEADISLTKTVLSKAEDHTINSEGLSPKTVSDIKMNLMAIIKFAKKKQYIVEVPECMSISYVQPPCEILTEPEQNLLEKLLYQLDSPFCHAVLLTLYSGIRIGEVCGLQWSDFDLDNGTIFVHKTVIRIKNSDSGSNAAKTKVILQKAKTPCSIRIIPLPDDIMDYLRQRKRDGSVFLLTGTEKFMEPRLCLYRYKKLLGQAGVRSHTYHALRHTFATRCVEKGMDSKTLCEIMGHSNVNITMQKYVHPSLEMKKAQMNKLSKSSNYGPNCGQRE